MAVLSKYLYLFNINDYYSFTGYQSLSSYYADALRDYPPFYYAKQFHSIYGIAFNSSTVFPFDPKYSFLYDKDHNALYLTNLSSNGFFITTDGIANEFIYPTNPTTKRFHNLIIDGKILFTRNITPQYDDINQSFLILATSDSYSSVLYKYDYVKDNPLNGTLSSLYTISSQVLKHYQYWRAPNYLLKDKFLFVFYQQLYVFEISNNNVSLLNHFNISYVIRAFFFDPVGGTEPKYYIIIRTDANGWYVEAINTVTGQVDFSKNIHITGTLIDANFVGVYENRTLYIYTRDAINKKIYIYKIDISYQNNTIYSGLLRTIHIEDAFDYVNFPKHFGTHTSLGELEYTGNAYILTFIKKDVNSETLTVVRLNLSEGMKIFEAPLYNTSIDSLYPKNPTQTYGVFINSDETYLMGEANDSNVYIFHYTNISQMPPQVQKNIIINNVSQIQIYIQNAIETQIASPQNDSLFISGYSIPILKQQNSFDVYNSIHRDYTNYVRLKKDIGMIVVNENGMRPLSIDCQVKALGEETSIMIDTRIFVQSTNIIPIENSYFILKNKASNTIDAKISREQKALFTIITNNTNSIYTNLPFVERLEPKRSIAFIGYFDELIEEFLKRNLISFFSKRNKIVITSENPYEKIHIMVELGYIFINDRRDYQELKQKGYKRLL